MLIVSFKKNNFRHLVSLKKKQGSCTICLPVDNRMLDFMSMKEQRTKTIHQHNKNSLSTDTD